MEQHLTCNQVLSLVNFYLENKLNPHLLAAVNKHLESCPNCKKKINEIKQIFIKYNNNTQQTHNTAITNTICQKLSEYLDNELNTNENLKIKKNTIINPTIKKEFENMCKIKKLMSEAYQKTQNDNKVDYSKIISAQLQGKDDYVTNYFYKLATVFVILITSIICCFIYLYF